MYEPDHLSHEKAKTRPGLVTYTRNTFSKEQFPRVYFDILAIMYLLRALQLAAFAMVVRISAARPSSWVEQTDAESTPVGTYPLWLSHRYP